MKKPSEKYLKQYPEAKRKGASIGMDAWPLCGIEEIREAVAWADCQPEYEHDYLTAEDVLSAYRKASR